MSVLVFFLACTVVLKIPEGTSEKIQRHFRENPVFDQNALFGPRKTIEALNSLPNDVKQKRLLSVVKSHDANGDDIIEFEELESWILEAFSIMDFDEAEKEWQQTDTNMDGFVSFEEAVVKRHETEMKEVEELQSKMDRNAKLDLEDREILQQVSDDRKMFEAADADADGLLNEQEFNRFDQPYNFPHMSKLKMDLTMEFGDLDLDGTISLEEFTREGSDDHQLEETKKQFDELDDNLDGQLTRAELVKWVVPDNHRGARQEASRLIGECDANHDGKLTIEEIVENESSFMLSLGTNFGVFLHFVKDEL